MTTPTVDPFEPITALLRQDFDTYERLLQQVDSRQFATAFTAAFTVAADRMFGQGQTVSDIITFVASVRARLDEAGDAVDPDKAERILRTVALGEDGLLDGVDEQTLGQIEAVLLLPLLNDTEGWDDMQLDGFLADARAVASEWESR